MQPGFKGFPATVLDAHTCQRLVGYRTVLLSKQRSQLSRGMQPHPQLSWQRSQSSQPPTLLAAMARPAADSDAVRAEFSQAGITEEVITKALNSYKYYLRWDPATKLRPALQLWLKHLGSQQLSERLSKYPKLLLRTPEECSDVYLWLASVGIDAERIQQQFPRVMARKLDDVQNTMLAIQQELLLMDEELPPFFRRHGSSLQYLPDHAVHTPQVVAELLAVPVASKEMRKVIRVCGQWLFDRDPAVLHQRVSFFCKEFKGGQQAAEAALKQEVYKVSEGNMRARAAELKAILGWTEDEFKACLNSVPRILNYQPATVANNIQKLQTHSFTSAQALDIYTSHPNLAGYDWSSPLNVEKLEYLMLVLQLSTNELASKPQLLSASLERNLGPRSEFMYTSKAIIPDEPLSVSGSLWPLWKCSDTVFAAKYNHLSASPPLMYNEAFKQHWQERWAFLRNEMGLAVADISVNRALLFTSLPNTLAPRWHCFTMVQAAQAEFKAADHLTALATLSDEHFAQAFSMPMADVA